MSVAETIKAELLALCPDFGAGWLDERELFTSDDGSYSVHGVFAVFSHFIADRLTHGHDPALAKVFEYVESKLNGDDSEVDNAATTCFLENLMNRVPDVIEPASFVSMLGPKSRDFCRAWDAWCGVTTDGL